ncbi:hypothetical protein CH63R_09795 [Colletotrichum higginsianum IMI 349063]|uniref:Uncharacterized protein n=1 Tax=Colletotrichum higginsianum (strain IMI 349063) TaxID=759273 RepID=A0A1B7Y0Y8_COLHI|nr:uncharacterized protein CH63R_09795 [Colletotrichum higginsianum IMI 349063]OBR05675.1 hypothetical protein CH63R_09795 [Colletotrichum higginsianum IMI 349063]
MGRGPPLRYLVEVTPPPPERHSAPRTRAPGQPSTAEVPRPKDSRAETPNPAKRSWKLDAGRWKQPPIVKPKIQDPRSKPPSNVQCNLSVVHCQNATPQHRSTATLRYVSSSSLFSSLPFQGFLAFSILVSSSSTTPTGSLVPRNHLPGRRLSTVSTRPNRRPLGFHCAPRGRSTHKSLAFVDGIRATVTQRQTSEPHRTTKYEFLARHRRCGRNTPKHPVRPFGA